MAIRIQAVMAAALVIGLSACATAPAGLAKKEAELKTFEAKAERAGVYIYRNESAAAFLSMQVEIDGKTVAKTGSMSFVYVDLAPGKHAITSKAENTDTLEIEVEAGKLYYVVQDPKPGNLYVRTKLRVVDEAEGQQGVKATKLTMTT